MSPKTPLTVTKYKCPKCGLKEDEDHQHSSRTGRDSYAKFHLCWFCLLKGNHVEMEIVK